MSFTGVQLSEILWAPSDALVYTRIILEVRFVFEKRSNDT
jgi:hypothetical protein